MVLLIIKRKGGEANVKGKKKWSRTDKIALVALILEIIKFLTSLI